MLSLSLLREHCKFIRLFLTRREVNLASELCNQHCTMIRERPWNTLSGTKKRLSMYHSLLFFLFLVILVSTFQCLQAELLVVIHPHTHPAGTLACYHGDTLLEPINIVVIGNNLTNAWTLLVDCSKGHHTTSTTLQDCEVCIVNNAATFEWL